MVDAVPLRFLGNIRNNIDFQTYRGFTVQQIEANYGIDPDHGRLVTSSSFMNT